MSCYISSNNNRLYAVVERQYGISPAVEARHRLPAVKLSISQEPVVAERKDKTGSRTFLGLPSSLRRRTSFDLDTYMTGWASPGVAPGYAALIQAALGGDPVLFNGATAGANSAGKILSFSSPHGLTAGQAVTFGGELRFVSAIADALTVVLNSEFSMAPSAGSLIGATITYFPSTSLRSASVLDYWSPADAIHRILSGAAVDKMRIRINGDYHEFSFSGQAMDVVDSTSFATGQAGLSAFPAEPAEGLFNYAIIPGHLGQAWLGSAPDRFYTITAAEVVLDNDLDLRNREFGSVAARCIAAGRRSVQVDFDLYEERDGATEELYQAARQRSPVEVMFQLGQEAGQLFGVHMGSVVLETPDFDDSETRLQWWFRGCRAQGIADDEITVAFG